MFGVNEFKKPVVMKILNEKNCISIEDEIVIEYRETLLDLTGENLVIFTEETKKFCICVCVCVCSVRASRQCR